MRIHTIEHVPFEGPGAIALYAEAQGHTLTRTRIFAGDVLPALESMGAEDMLVVMGGPMSVHDEAAYPWLRMEKQYVRRCADAGVRVLGVCLGAQLLAEVLGGTVIRNPHREIGWFPVRLTDAGRQSPCFAGFPDVYPAFHWHGETFSIPPSATCAGESDACAHQAFVVDDRLVGVQFHLETTPESLDQLITHCGDELIPQTAYVQSAELMRAHIREQSETAVHSRRLLDTLLGNMLCG